MSEHQELIAKIDQLIEAVRALAGTQVASTSEPVATAPAELTNETLDVASDASTTTKKRGRPRKEPAAEVEPVVPTVPAVPTVPSPPAATAIPLPAFLIDPPAAPALAPVPAGCPITNADQLREFVMAAFQTKGADNASRALQALGFTSLGQIHPDKYEQIWRVLS